MRVHLLVAAALVCVACRTQTRAPQQAPASFVALRASHPTQLRQRSSLGRRFDNEALDARYTAVRYPGASSGAQLRGWIAPGQGQGPAPLLVYLHGNFALSVEQLDEVRAHVPAAFTVFAPTWRAENGNDGDFELLVGEVQDAAAAIRWAAARDDIDPRAIHVLGHSVGGGIAALLTLEPDLPVAQTVSVGGIYVPETFARWRASTHNAELIRFDPQDPLETRLRTLAGNAADMVRPHVAYVGTEDTWFHPNARGLEAAAKAAGSSVEVRFVEGDHMSSLPVAIDAYVQTLSPSATRGAPGPA